MSVIARNIYQASDDGDLVEVARLLQSASKEDLSCVDGDGCTALIQASANGHGDIAKLLVYAGANKDVRDAVTWTALMWASWRGHTNAVEVLVDAGAGKDLQDEQGKTALMMAAEKGHTEVVEILVNAGADRKLKAKTGCTAFGLAETEEIQTLLSKREDTPAWFAERVKLLSFHLSEAPKCTETIQKVQSLQAQYDAALAAAEDFHLVATLGKSLLVPFLQLSEEDYFLLPTRYIQLQHEMENRCAELLDAKQYLPLEELGAELEKLKGFTLPAIHPGRKAEVADVNRLLSQCAELEGKYDDHTRQMAQVPQRAEMMQRLEASQAQYDAEVVARRDFRLIGSLGRALEALKSEEAQLPLSTEVYETLAGTHNQLVEEFAATCRNLAEARQYDEVLMLAEKLKILKSLNHSILSQTGADDPVLPSAPSSLTPVATVDDEDDNANDPVLPPPLAFVSNR